MSTCIVFTNWKMNKTMAETKDFFARLVKLYGSRNDLELIMCIPSLYIHAVAASCSGTCIHVGSENVYPGDWGAYTGETSAPMLRSVGCDVALIGHSERRKYFHEDDHLVGKKLKSALEHGLFPIVCIGETREERDAGQMLNVLERQVDTCFQCLTPESRLHIAYEPRWSIGTGIIPEYAQIEEAHRFIREEIENRYGSVISGNIKLLYGGSVSPENSFAICSLKHVDGVGYGGCSLDLHCLSRGIEESVRAFQASSS
jgi:triosephosphate isomerase